MTMKQIGQCRSLLICLVRGVAALLITGCSSTPRKYPVVIYGGASVRGSVQVDVVGVTPSELTDWESYPLDRYFPDSPKRRNADKVTFRPVEANGVYQILIADEV